MYLQYKSIKELKAMNRRRGYHFFDKSTLRFFNSVVYNNVRTGTTGWYFVTSEQFEDNPRRFTVRKMDESSRVATIGRFMEYHTFEDALDMATLGAALERRM